MITLFVFAVTILLITLVGLVINMSLYNHSVLNKVQRKHTKSSTRQLHEIIFMQYLLGRPVFVQIAGFVLIDFVLVV